MVPAMNETTWLAIAELWLAQTHSVIDIGQQLSLPFEEVAQVVGVIEKVETLVERRVVQRVKEALFIFD